MRFSILLALIFGFVAACAFGQDEAESANPGDMISPTAAPSSVDQMVTATTSTITNSAEVVATTASNSIDFTSLTAYFGSAMSSAMVSASDFKDFGTFPTNIAIVSRFDASIAAASPALASSFASFMSSLGNGYVSKAINALETMNPAERSSVASEISTEAASLSNNPAELSTLVSATSYFGVDLHSYNSAVGAKLQSLATASPGSANATGATTTSATTTVHPVKGSSNATQSSSSSTSDGMAPATALPYAAVGAGFLLVGWL